MTDTDVKGFSPKDIGDAVDSALPSMTLAERNAMTETGDRAMSPNDIRVAIENEKLAVPDTTDIKTLGFDTRGYRLTEGGVYTLDGTWEVTKTIVIYATEKVTIIGSNNAKITSDTNLFILLEDGNLEIQDVSGDSSDGVALLTEPETSVKISRCDFDVTSSAIIFGGGKLEIIDSKVVSTGSTGIHLRTPSGSTDPVDTETLTVLRTTLEAHTYGIYTDMDIENISITESFFKQ